MGEKLPPELELLALNTLLSLVISVLDDNQKKRLADMVKLRPVEVADDTTQELIGYQMGMKKLMLDTVRLGLGHDDYL